VEENGVHRENHVPATSRWQNISHNVVLPEDICDYFPNFSNKKYSLSV
jgi:hypothetical protein